MEENEERSRKAIEGREHGKKKQAKKDDIKISKDLQEKIGAAMNGGKMGLQREHGNPNKTANKTAMTKKS